MDGVNNEKIDCHRFSGMATQCVELLGPDIERISKQRSAKSFLFAGKNKTLKIRGGVYELLSFIRCTQYGFVAKKAQQFAVMISTVFEVATAPLHRIRHSNSFWSLALLYIVQ